MKRIGARRVVLAVAVLALTLALPSFADNSRLLPDARLAPVGCPGGHAGDPVACADWDVCMVRDRAAPSGPCVRTGPVGAVRLRFTTAVDNVGDGPLLLYGLRTSTDEPVMKVRQAFQTGVNGEIPDSYLTAQRSTPTTAYYEPARAHRHWHLTEFTRFELRAPGGGALVTDRKNGFCLGDRYTTHDAAELDHAVAGVDSPQGQLGQVLAENMCGMLEPNALAVTQGISVGRGDSYHYTVDFQWLDLTTVRSGVYDVVNTVNADRALLESNYANNSSSIAVSVQWPAGAAEAPWPITAPPVVTLLRSCPGKERCAT